MKKDPTPEEWNQTKWLAVDEPPHYNVGEIECIDYIRQQLGDQFGAYLLGNCIKYLHRHKYKGAPTEDLRKAQWYLNRLIEESK
jgi:hypothetical protein